MVKPENYDFNVFLNCPFDDAYESLLRATVFTLLACGFTPMSALQERDAAAIRLDKIKRLIERCRLSVHDISRTSLDSASGLPRFNMPFELGLDLGARQWGNAHLKQKQIIILDTERYRYQTFLSDISGQDISAHQNSAKELISKLRTWLNLQRGAAPMLASSRHLERMFNRFLRDLPSVCRHVKLDPDSLEYNDFQALAISWIELNT